jgi:hypothetical protein
MPGAITSPTYSPEYLSLQAQQAIQYENERYNRQAVAPMQSPMQEYPIWEDTVYTTDFSNDVVISDDIIEAYLEKKKQERKVSPRLDTFAHFLEDSCVV